MDVQLNLTLCYSYAKKEKEASSIIFRYLLSLKANIYGAPTSGKAYFNSKYTMRRYSILPHRMTNMRYGACRFIQGVSNKSLTEP